MAEWATLVAVLDDPVSSQFEYDLLRHAAYSPKTWLRYIEHLRHHDHDDVDFGPVDMVWERAVKVMPTCYKLWHGYIGWKMAQFRESISPSSSASINLEHLVSLFERALIHLPRMPRLWLDYLNLLGMTHKLTACRQLLNRALAALPPTQHDRLWEWMRKWTAPIAKLCPLLVSHLWLRQWQHLNHTEHWAQETINRLKECDRFDEAACIIKEMLDAGHGDWHEHLLVLLMAHGEAIHSLPVEAILRQAIQQQMEALSLSALQGGHARLASSQAGRLWCALAGLYLRQGLFERARAVYEEALSSVNTLRDATMIWDAWARMEETFTTFLVNKQNDSLSLEWQLSRLERLVKQRPIWMADVRLRQQPHRVDWWRQRISFDPDNLELWQTALKALVPNKVRDLEGLVTLWIDYARRLPWDKAQAALQTATSELEWPNADSLASLWLSWSDFVREHHGDIGEALKLLATPCHPAPSGTVAHRLQLHKSRVLWQRVLDLEEARGLPLAIKAAYERVIELGLGTVLIFASYADWLNNQQPDCKFSEVFRVYERGIQALGYPAAIDLWSLYLPQAIRHYAPLGQIERLRDLCEQSLRGCPPQYAAPLYLLYARVEEEHGLSSAVIRVLERALDNVPVDQQWDLLHLLLAKAKQLKGPLACRPIYEHAMARQPSTRLSLEWSSWEESLGEYERARAILQHAALTCDPRTNPSLWEAWKAFELRHGSELTMRELLRVQRSVRARYELEMPFVPASTNPVAKERNEEELDV